MRSKMKVREARGGETEAVCMVLRWLGCKQSHMDCVDAAGETTMAMMLSDD